MALCGGKAKSGTVPERPGGPGGAPAAPAACCCYHTNPDDPNPDLRGEATYERMNAEACAARSGECVEDGACGTGDCAPDDPNCLDTGK